MQDANLSTVICNQNITKYNTLIKNGENGTVQYETERIKVPPFPVVKKNN